MNKIFIKIFFLLLAGISGIYTSLAQCAVCTKTAQQLGDGPAQALNTGILYLMVIPLSLIFIIGYRWYKREQHSKEEAPSSKKQP